MEAGSLSEAPAAAWDAASPPGLSQEKATCTRQHGAVDTCVICLEAISERAITVPCNHYSFDFICLASWLNERANCPLCNAPVSEVQYDWSSAKDFKSYRVPTGEEIAKQNPRYGGRADVSRRGIPRLSSIRRARRQRSRPSPAPTEDEAIQRRRSVYRHQLYSLHVGSNRVSRYRNITPQIFGADSELQSRARNWIRRELRVFSYLNPTSGEASSGSARQANNAEFLLEYIVAILKTVDIKGSGGQAEDMLSEFLGRDDARLFLHELSAWLRSPFINLPDWDRNVQYGPPSSGEQNGPAVRDFKGAGRNSTAIHAQQSSRRVSVNRQPASRQRGDYRRGRRREYEPH